MSEDRLRVGVFWDRLDADFADEIKAGRLEVSQRMGARLGGGDLWLPKTIEENHALHREIEAMSGSKHDEWTRAYCIASPFYLARFVLSTKNPDWIVDGHHALDHPLPIRFLNWLQFCEKSTLFLLAREHLKSTLSTLVRTIHINLDSPNLTIAILSDTLDLARQFTRQIKREYEGNPDLYRYFPEIVWADPKKESDQWSLSGENAGLVLKRQTNVKEATVTPIGLDTAPKTGPHFDIRRYDDIVTNRNTQTSQAMAKTRTHLKASASLGKDGGYDTYVGTLYHPLDAYHDLQSEDEEIGECRVSRVVRIPCYEDTEECRGPVYYSPDYLHKKRVECGHKEFAIQWKLDLEETRTQKVDEEWIRYYDPTEEVQRRNGFESRSEYFARHSNLYMLVDGAGGEKQNTTDFTVMQMWGCLPDETHVLLDALRDQLDPLERVLAAMRLHQKWGMYRFQNCRWEQYAMDSDTFWLKKEMDQTANHFHVIPVAGASTTKGMGAKEDRITGRLFPVFKKRKILLPDSLMIECVYLDGGSIDYTQVFVQQILAYPLVKFDDDVDCASRLFDPDLPLDYPERAMREGFKDKYAKARDRRDNGGESNWVS